MNYSLREENDKKNNSLTNTTFQESNLIRVKSLKHIKNQFFSTHLILPKPSWFYSGVSLLDKSKTKASNISHKNTISEIPSLNKGNTSNNNTTANTHKNSGKKNTSNSFKKCKINLKTLTRKNSYIKNNNKIKRANICPVRNILNRNNSNISITKEESKNNNNKTNYYSFMSKTQFEEKNNKKENLNEIKEIYTNLLIEEKENELNINSLYFKNQPEINEKMRAILIDWLIDVHFKFKLKADTLFLTIWLVDKYLSLKKIKRNKLQLIGVTCMLIACK